MTLRSTRLAWIVVLAAMPFAPAQEPKATPRRVVKTDAEWSKLLTREQFLVTRRKATEPAFSGKLLHNKGKGIYACVCCNSPLFASQTKFESGTGWPSFYAPYDATSVVNEADYSYGQVRVEVLCATCGAHLGHVFNDGPRPTGLRFCMNSAALRFVKAAPASAKGATKDGEAAKATQDDPTKPSSDDPDKPKQDDPGKPEADGA